MKVSFQIIQDTGTITIHTMPSEYYANGGTEEIYHQSFLLPKNINKLKSLIEENTKNLISKIITEKEKQRCH